MRKICWLLIITLLMGCLAACQSSSNSNAIENPDGTLTQRMKDLIEDDYYKWQGRDFGTWYEDGVKDSLRYYGNDNGYIIIFWGQRAWWGAGVGRSIGNYHFSKNDGQMFTLFAYKDGAFSLLSEIYEQGLISDAAMEAAVQAHNDCEVNSD